MFIFIFLLKNYLNVLFNKNNSNFQMEYIHSIISILKKTFTMVILNLFIYSIHFLNF